MAFQPWQSAALLDSGQWWSGELSGQLESGPLVVASSIVPLQSTVPVAEVVGAAVVGEGVAGAPAGLTVTVSFMFPPLQWLYVPEGEYEHEKYAAPAVWSAAVTV